MSKQKTTPQFSKQSIELFEEKILAETAKIKTNKIENNSISYKEIASNFPLVKCAIFIDSNINFNNETKILYMLYNIFAFSNVKVFLVGGSILRMSPLKSYINHRKESFFLEEELNLNVIKHVIDNTQPEISILFSNSKIGTDSLLSFQVKNKEILFQSKPTTIEELIEIQ